MAGSRANLLLSLERQAARALKRPLATKEHEKSRLSDRRTHLFPRGKAFSYYHKLLFISHNRWGCLKRTEIIANRQLRLSVRMFLSPRKTVISCLSVLILAAFAGQVYADGMPTEESGTKPEQLQRPKAPGGKGSQKPASATPAIRKTPAASGNTTPLSDFELARYQYCGKDSDCTIAINGCCDCANGGTEVAVNKERLEVFRKRFDCLYVQCGSEPADPPCESGVVSCLNHRCAYFDESRKKQQKDEKEPL